MMRALSRLFATALLLLGCVALSAFALRCFYQSAYPARYLQPVLDYSESNNLSPELVMAVIRTESGFRPQAQSHLGARGLMQITEETFDWVKVRIGGTAVYDDLYLSEVNIEYGTALLRLLLDEFGSVENALGAYHAGFGSMQRWLADDRYSQDGLKIDFIPFPDTSHYIRKVISTTQIYAQLYNFSPESAAKKG